MIWTVEKVRAGDEELLHGVRELWTAYWASLGLSAGFQGFGEELRTLPGHYQPPHGCLLLARSGEGQPAATAAFRPLPQAAACEAKRLYVHPGFRRHGLAKVMLARLVDEARSCGYEWIFGDTLPSMAAAQRLYAEWGFTEVGPYAADPTPGAVYLRLKL